MIISDEQGWQWLILPTDPAAGLVSHLKRIGFPVSSIVLPRAALKTGSVEGSVPTLEALQKMLVSQPVGDHAPVFLRYMTLHDCCQALEGLVE